MGDPGFEAVVTKHSEEGFIQFVVRLVAKYNTDISREFAPEQMRDLFDEVTAKLEAETQP